MTTVASLPRITAPELSKIILSQSLTTKPTIAVIDVRDEDHIGGHINGAHHIPSRTLDHAIPSLVHQLRDKENVVFHCALSQQRGPSAALQYVRARERLLGTGFAQTAVGEAMKRNKEENLQEDGVKDDKDEGDGWEDVPTEDTKKNKEKTQRVYVLEDGFVGWQEAYGTDERLTVEYDRELWRDGGPY